MLQDTGGGKLEAGCRIKTNRFNNICFNLCNLLAVGKSVAE